MKILLLEDDPILQDIMSEHLRELSYDVFACSDGEEALELIDEENFDLYIFDINVPLKSGLEVLKCAREYHKTTPTILITAYQDIEHLKAGFDSGCNDYIKKPFELEELDQRIVNIKNHFGIESQKLIRLSSNIEFDLARHEVIKDGKVIRLAQKECQILNYFYNNRGRVISLDELIQNIWKFDDIPTDATLRVYIKNIRNIIGKDKIDTIRGFGYCFE